MSETTTHGVYVTLEQLAALRHKARGFSLLPRQPVASLLAGGHGSKLRGRGLDFEEIRQYLPGDDPRTIDWKVTARTRKPHSRVFTEERERPVLLLVDQRIGMFFGSVKVMKSVAAAECAALAAWRTVAVKDRVGAVVFNDTELTEIRPQRTRSTVMHLLRTVEKQNRALRADSPVPPGPGMLNEALRRTSRVATHDFLVVLITDAAGANADTRQLITTIARHNDVLISFVLDPLETDLPAAGNLVVSDGARQMEVDTGSASIRSGFRREFDERFAAAKKFLLTREVPVLPVRTDADVTDQVLRALGARRGPVVPDPDPGSLERLHDIVVPPPVSWWPPAPGWYVVGGIGLVLLGAGAWAVLARWNRNRYRREALSELDLILQHQPGLSAVFTIAELLKRVALAAFPRERVAALTGAAWLGFLDATGGTDAFTRGAGRALGDAIYQRGASVEPPDIPALAAVVRHWITHHRC